MFVIMPVDKICLGRSRNGRICLECCQVDDEDLQDEPLQLRFIMLSSICV